MRRLVLSAALLVASCATPMMQLSPISFDGSDGYYSNGQPIVARDGEKFTVLIMASSTLTERDNRLRLILALINNTDQPVTFDEGRITARVLNGPSVAVLSAQTLRREAQRAIAIARFGAAMSAAGAAMTPEQTTSSGIYTGSVGNVPVSGIYTTTIDNSAAVTKAQANANRQAAEASSFAQRRMSEAVAGSVIPQTIPPNGRYTTPFTLEKITGNSSQAKILVIDVALPGENHSLRIELNPAG